MRRTLALMALGLVLVGCQAAPVGAPRLGSAYGAPESAASPAANIEAQPSPAASTGPAAVAKPDAPATSAAAASSPAKPAAAAVEVFRIVPEQSEVRYEVGEVFFREGNRFNVAVGVTKAVSGVVRIDRAQPRNSSISPIVIDISAFTSDRARRDQLIRERWLESARFPQATFTPTRVEGLPERYAEGTEVALRVTGDLTIREATRPTTFAVTAKLTGDTLTVTGTTTIRMTDFGFDPPEILGTLKAENEAKLAFTFIARSEKS